MMLRRFPVVAGHFYEDRPDALAEVLDALLHPGTSFVSEPAMTALLPPDVFDSGKGDPVPVRFALLPHAGHAYCGTLIGRTLRRIRLPRRLVLLCPTHTGEGRPLAVWPSGAWRTPLGDVPVDEELAAALIASGGGFAADTAAHLREHALEVILPFIQRAVPEVRIAPVCAGCAPSQLQAAGEALAEVVRNFRAGGEEVGLVVSSDMNHYAAQAETVRRDALALKALTAADPVRLYNTVAVEGISMCGVRPAVLALFALRSLGETRVVLTGYLTSGTVSGDTRAVVGYAGAYAC